MPQSLPSPSVSFKHLVATQFASRPGLREVVASAGFDALAARYPWTRKNHPQLQSLTGFSILHDLDEGPPTPPGNLVDTLLEHFLSGQPMALKPTDQLSLNPPAIFRPQHVAPAIDIRIRSGSSSYLSIKSRITSRARAYDISQGSFPPADAPLRYDACPQISMICGLPRKRSAT